MMLYLIDAAWNYRKKQALILERSLTRESLKTLNPQGNPRIHEEEFLNPQENKRKLFRI